jgi:hypothetical protein
MAVDAAEAGKHLPKADDDVSSRDVAVKRAVEHGVITRSARRFTPRRITPHRGRCPLGRARQVLPARSTSSTRGKGIGRAPDTRVPEGLDWDPWLGPALGRDFNALLRLDSAHHPSFMAYSGG